MRDVASLLSIHRIVSGPIAVVKALAFSRIGNMRSHPAGRLRTLHCSEKPEQRVDMRRARTTWGALRGLCHLHAIRWASASGSRAVATLENP